MSILVAEQELYRSCRILFGSELEVGGDFLNYLRHSGLKKAYRLKARQTHPDLAVVNQALVGSGCLTDFAAVQQAYENLCGFLDRRDLGGRFSAVPPRPEPPGVWKGQRQGGGTTVTPGSIAGQSPRSGCGWVTFSTIRV